MKLKNQLLQAIEKSRQLMIDSIHRNGLTHKETVRLSQELDSLIMLHQQKNLQQIQRNPSILISI